MQSDHYENILSEAREYNESEQAEFDTINNTPSHENTPSPNEKTALPRGQYQVSPQSMRYFPILFNIVNGSIWAGLARKGLMVLTTYDGSFLGGVVWANFASCLVMGIAMDSQRVWSKLLQEPQYPNKGAIPVYTGITTGFCGTLSSFSSLILECFTKAADITIGNTYEYPNAAYGIMQFLAVIISQLAISVAGYFVGKHIAEIFDQYVPPISKKSYKVVEVLCITVAILGMTVNCVLIGVKPHGAWRSWTFSVLFSPFGAILRYYLARLYNSKVPNFPMGTFVTNVAGTTLLAILNLLGRGKFHSRGGPIVNNIMGCHVLIGLQDGFCGSFTTISTFVVEICGLKTAHSYRYGAVSVILSFIMVLLILGSYNWTVGLTDPVCT